MLLKNTFCSIYGSILANNGVQFVSSGITIVVLWVGSSLVIGKTITPGTLMLFYTLVGYVVSPISSLITSNQTIQDALIAADRLFQIMDLEVEEESILSFDLEPDMIRDIVSRMYTSDMALENRSLKTKFANRGRQDYSYSWGKWFWENYIGFSFTTYLFCARGRDTHWQLYGSTPNQ